MKDIFRYRDCQEEFNRWISCFKTGAQSAEAFLSDYDESSLKEGERLNIILCPIKWEVEHDGLSSWLAHELFLYYQQLVHGELENVIAEEEKEAVAKDLTECFNKAFPNWSEEEAYLLKKYPNGYPDYLEATI